MSDAEHALLYRLLDNHGIAGMAEELAFICRERAAIAAPEEGTRALWTEAARRFDAVG